MKSAIEESIFEVALSLEDAAVRQEFLQQTFRDDPQGMQRMLRLLNSASDATSFFLEAREVRSQVAEILVDEIPDHAIHAITVGQRRDGYKNGAPLPAEIGSMIGNYQLIRCLGKGGSGIVYEAEQTAPVMRRVALKIFWIDTGSSITKARFDVERQALAIMDHPNIAKVLDAGGFHNGSPYFIMELVEGEPITSYCDREMLNLRQRIELFIDVCDAIQHAHSKRIIHRDIKPSNVLVTKLGNKAVAKVIDFGIAKAVVSGFEARPAITHHDQFLGTPAYMSPEQVEMIGIDVDTRSDIYSLGVLLYELLTSCPPFDRRMLVDAGMANMRRVLLDKLPPKPSVRLAELSEEDKRSAAEVRHTDVSRLLNSIRGDLDWIIMKTLEKDRNSRYETASALALDLKSYLENKPVTARRQNNFYTFRKFVSRNRMPFYSAVAVAASITLGFGASTVLYFREKAALNEQERLSLEAQRSRDQELHLRRQAQARVNVSTAAFLLSEGKVSEADELLRKTPLVSIEPSKEASSVFRTLGNWYATYDRWADAVQCFRFMAQATQMIKPDDLLRGTDLLITGPALLELGDKTGYEEFRHETITRHLPVRDSLQAEHILKATLIIDATPQMLDQLQNAAALCESSILSYKEGSFPAWEAFSLALYYHRKGEHQKVLDIASQALPAPNIREVCTAGLRVLEGAAHYELGNEKAARASLKAAKSVIKNPKTDEGSEEKAIFYKWYDWSVADLLLKEVEKTMKIRSNLQ